MRSFRLRLWMICDMLRPPLGRGLEGVFFHVVNDANNHVPTNARASCYASLRDTGLNFFDYKPISSVAELGCPRLNFFQFFGGFP